MFYNQEEELLDNDQADTIFRDITLLALSGFISILILLLPWLNFQTKDIEIKEPVGSVIFELFWSEKIDADLDLWVRGPHDTAVGYAQPSGQVFNLLRDDRGLTADHTPLNYEISFTRGILIGEYQANVHLFKHDKSKTPIEATIIASLVTPDRGYRKEILGRKVVLNVEGKEKTVLRFKLDNNFKIVEGSVNNLRKSLIGKY
tara:strand:+ start:1180 stop:1788 length:609 start_codon:yes stop_codon:yes gene_type:complete